MEKRKTYINVISAFAITTLIAGAFLITSCGKTSPTEKFTEERLLVSKGEYFDVSNYYKGKDAEFFSMDENIVSQDSDKFIGVNPGVTYIYSVVNGEKSSFIEIYVKDEFSNPSDIKISDTGLISWNSVFSFIKGEKSEAKYELKINDELFDTTDSFYQLTEEGVYNFSIRAAGTEMIDPSPWSGNIVLYYKHLDPPSGLKFTPDIDVNSMKGVLTWSSIEDATYRVTVNGFLYETADNKIELDFAQTKGSSVNICVEAVDTTGRYLSSKEDMTLRKLASPKLEYKDGELTWNAIEGAIKYHIIYTNQEGEKFDFTTTETSTILDDAEAGVYTVNIQSIAGENMLNSNSETFEKKVVKLQPADVAYSLGTNYVDVDISSESDYLKNFIIYKNGEEFAAKIESGKKTTVRIPLTDGKYDFSVRSLPSYDNDNILPLDGINSVIDSNLTETKTMYMLEKAKNLTHKFDESGNSILEFDKIEYAEDYEVYINDKRINFTSSEHEAKILLNLGVIDREFYGLTDNLTFEFKVIAKKNNDTINSETSKEIKIFDKVSGLGANGIDINTNKYVWEGIQDAKYRVKIYRAKDSSFQEEELELISNEETLSTETEELDGGFYKIEVQTLSTDENIYWSSSNIMTDTFIVSEEEENPYFLDFYYNDEHSSDLSGYEIKFKNPAAAQTPYINPRKYEIYINGAKIIEGIAKTEEEILIYKFSSAYQFNSGITKIELRTLCTDTEMQKIYKPSTKAVLNVEKLSTPEKESVSLEEDNLLNVALQTNAERLIFTNALGEEFKQDGEYLQKIDLSSFVGSFDINVRYDTHKTFESDTPFTDGTFYIESNTFTIHCQRAEVPTNFKYRKKVISFDHTGEVENYDLTLKIKTKNDTIGKTWRTRISTKSYNLDELIGQFDSEFDYYYSQKTEMEISVYACISKYVGDIFYIPSINESETDKGIITISVTQLNNVSDLIYNKTTDKLTWSSDNSKGTEYEIYYNGVLQDIVTTTVREDERNYYEYSLSWLSTLPNNDYKFKIVATKDDSFDSNFSNEVTVRKLKALDQIKIYTDKETHKTYIKWDITSEQINLVDKIVINDEEIAVEERLGQKELDSENIRIKLISKGESSSSIQYRDSEVVVFSVKEAYDSDYTEMIYGDLLKKPTNWFENGDLAQSKIIWKAYEDDNTWSGNNISNKDLISYIFEVYNSDNQLVEKSEVGGNNYIDITSAILKNLQDGEYSINVYAYFKEYSLVKSAVLGGQGAYLSKYLSSSNIPIKKLTPVTNLQYSIDETLTTTYTEELNKKLTVTWEHSDFASDIYYNIQFLDENYQVVYEKAVKGVKSLEMQLSEIAPLNIAFMKIMAYSPNHIFSNETQIQINKNRLPQATLGDRGLLSITSGSATDRYIVKVVIEGIETNYVLQDKTNEDIFKNFDISKLAENAKGQKETISISIVAVGGGSFLPAATEGVIEKEILGQGVYDIYGEYIFFRNEFADKVYILYDDGEEVQTEVLDKQVILYKAGNTSEYEYFASNAELLNINETQYMGGFRFKIPESWKGKSQRFTYYFEKQGMGSSWFDSNLVEDMKELSVNNNSVENLTEIDIGIDELTNKVYAECQSNVDELFIEVLSNEETLFYGYLIGKTIPIWNIEELMGGKFPVGEYTIKVWSVKRNAKASTDYSNIYEFTYTKNENKVTNVRIGETGYLEWDDVDEGSRYLLEFDDLNFVVSERKFDLRLLGVQEFNLTIKKLGNIPFGERINISSLQNRLVTITDEITINNSLLGELRFTPDFTFKEVNENAEIVLEVEQPLEYKLFMEYNKMTYPVEKFNTDYTNSQYLIRIREIDLIDILGVNFTENISSIKLSMTLENSVKSKSVNIDVNMIKNESQSKIEQRKAGNLFDEYLVYSSELIEECNKVIIRIKDSTGIIYDDIEPVIKGYWLAFEDSLKDGFYQSNMVESISSTEVRVIKISDLLNRIEMPDGGQYVVEVAPIISGVETMQMEWLNTTAQYKRLKGATGIEVYNKGTKIKWYDNEPDVDIYQYMLSYAKINYYVDKDIREFSYDKFEAGVKSDFDVYAISSNVGYMYSQKKSLKDVKRNGKIDTSIVMLENGTLHLSWGTGLTEEEKENIGSTNEAVSIPAINKIFEEGNFLKVLEMAKCLNYSVNMMPKIDLVKKILNIDYTAPISFNINTFKQENFELKFMQGESSYSLTVNVLDIMQKIDDEYISILNALIEGIAGYDEYSYITAFISILNNERNEYYTGVACDKILFDEIDVGKGNDIAGGEYNLIVNQWGNPSRNSLKSRDNVVKEGITVLKAPSMSCEKVDIVNNDGQLITSRYSLTFTPLEGHNKYKLVFKSNGELYKSFVIEKVDTNWVLQHNLSDVGPFVLSEVSGKIIIPLNSVGRDANNETNIEGIDSIIEFGDEVYTASIYAYGTGLEFNSKSDSYQLVYLKQSEITMNNGCANFHELLVMDREFKPYVIYQTEGAAENAYSITTPIKTGQVYSYIPKDGKYNFIAFVTRGEVNGYTIFIDSPICLIDKPFKIYSPEVDVKDGYINIQESLNNQELIETGLYNKHYTIANDLEKGYFITTDFTGNSYTYIAGPAGYVGEEEKFKEYKQSEINATQFNIRNTGSQGVLTTDTVTNVSESGYNNGLGKVLYLKFKETTLKDNRILFQSENISIDARMLESTNISLTEAGNFQWTAIDSSVDNKLSADGYLVYKLTITYYRQTGIDASGKAIYDKESEENIYTTSTQYSAQLLKIFSEESEKYAYTLSVSGMYYNKTGNDVDKIETIEGEIFYKQTNATYNDNLSMILRSDTVTTEKLERMAAVTDLTISNGQISWKYEGDSSSFKVLAAKTGTEDKREVKGLITVVNVDDNNIHTFNFKIDKDEKFDINQTYNLWVIAIDSGTMKQDGSKEYKKIASVEEKYVSSFIKLPTFDKNYLSVSQDYTQEKVTLDFSEYMNRLNSIGGSKNYFKLSIDVSVGGGASRTIVLSLINGMTVTIYFKDGTSSDNIIYMGNSKTLRLAINPQANGKDNIVNGETTEIEFTRADWSTEDVIEWREETKEFVWSYGKTITKLARIGAELYYKNADDTFEKTDVTITNETQYNFSGVIAGWSILTVTTVDGSEEYYIKNEDVYESVSYSDIDNIKFDIEIITRENVTDSSYVRVKRVYKDISAEEFDGMKGGRFAPILNGTFESISVYVKVGEKNFASTAKKYPEGDGSQSQILDYFGGGNGSETNPYIITNAEQFKLINCRTSVAENCKTFYEERARIVIKPYSSIIPMSSGDIQYPKIYYKQTKDLELEFEDVLITNDFTGVYEGNDKIVSIRAKNGAYSEILRSEASLTDELAFTKGVALFNKLNDGSEIKNLNLNVKFDNEVGENTIFSGIAIENNGTISKIVVKEITFNFNTVVENGGCFISGVVGVNNGNIIDCLNEADINISTGLNQTSLILSINSIASVNNGNITGCGNTGNIVAKVNSLVDARISGVVGYNTGVIFMCFNEGTLQAKVSTSNVGYIGGISVYSTNAGSISYVYNKGDIYGGNNSCGGIVYKVDKSMKNVFAFGMVNNSKGQVLAYQQGQGVSNSYTHQGHLFSGTSSISSDITVSSGSYSIVATVEGSEVSLSLQKNNS